MTTASHPRSNKKESVPRALPPLVACLQAPGGLQWPRAQAAASPSPNPAHKCEAARSAAHTPPLPASAQNFEPVHVKLSLPFQRRTELWEKLGSDDCGGWARALFFFSSTFFFFLSSVQSFGSSPFLLPPRSQLVPPPRFSPTCVRYLLGGNRRGCPVFTRRTARRGNFNTARDENKYLNTDAGIRCPDRHLNFGISRRSGRPEVSVPSSDPVLGPACGVQV